MKTTRKILAGSLTLFVLVSVISHSISFHFCGGEVQSMSIFGAAQQCEEHDNACDHRGSTSHTSINHKGCCEDATFKIDSDQYTYEPSDKISVESYQYIFLPVADVAPEFNPIVSLADTHFLHYKPPIIERDIHILVQSFLI
ncbi:MAG: hypothetical protein JSU09_04245 [Bacteroidetes bacterium]|nr:hypothetical protein [Bacteroidota bacterium]